MKTYSTVVSGREMSKFIHIPDEFRETELKVVLRPLQKKKERFTGTEMGVAVGAGTGLADGSGRCRSRFFQSDSVEIR